MKETSREKSVSPRRSIMTRVECRNHKFVQAKICLKEGTKIESQREISQL